ncbi:TadE family type IV pilus minor pilin [Agromyces archimandritae]|uniref:TadE family type IV pilus minor pilin n=1 Tax=Agromyces archimandritae TaxID=2781962 RepID=UPI001FD5DCAE|nr:TadE family type IV pilus minor pilin [Agromyces archimandritae]
MTAEFAVALPAVALVLAACLAAVQLVTAQVRLTDAAADAARALGRGEAAASAAALVERMVGGAALAERREGEFVCATVTAGGGGLFAAVELRADSCALAGGL